MDTALGINISNGNSYKAIIAEDSFTDRQLLKRFLQASQFDVLADVENGDKVLDHFSYDKEIPDILFLDYKMEPLNAIDVIKQIKPSHPEIKIVIVTGNTDKNVIAELIKFKIDSYILKPVSKSLLDEKLIQLLGRNDLVVKSKIATKKTSLKLEDLSIPPLPSIAQKVLLFEADPVSGFQELELIILPDKSICADILRIANSAYYARQKKIQTLKDAITLLGLKTVKNIVMLQTKKHLSRNLTYSEVFKKYLLELPILTALVALDLSTPFGLKSLREELFLPSMLSKIGMTILALNFPTVYTEILNQHQSGDNALVTLEKYEFDLSHVEVGLYIFNQWKMPTSFLTIMKYQNFDISENRNVTDLERILRVAGILSKKMLHIRVSQEDMELAEAIIEHYKAPKETVDVFGEDYYEDIKSHPFFEVV